MQVRAVGVRPRTPLGTRRGFGTRDGCGHSRLGWARRAGWAQGPWEALPWGRAQHGLLGGLWGPRRGLWASGRWAAHLGGEHQGLGGARQCEARAHPVQSDVRLGVAPGCRRAEAPGHGGCGLVAPGCGGHLCEHMSGRVHMGFRARGKVAVGTGSPVEPLTRPLSWTVLSAVDGDPQDVSPPGGCSQGAGHSPALQGCRWGGGGREGEARCTSWAPPPSSVPIAPLGAGTDGPLGGLPLPPSNVTLGGWTGLGSPTPHPESRERASPSRRSP